MALAIMLGASLAPAGQTDNPILPIKSASALQDYLHTTPPGTSPLDQLSPPARQRFLRGLVFGKNGLGGFSVAELDAELTRDEARAILELFDAESYLSSVHARPEHLSIGASESAEVSTHFDDLMAAHGSVAVAGVYDRWFRPGGHSADPVESRTSFDRHSQRLPRERVAADRHLGDADILFSEGGCAPSQSGRLATRASDAGDAQARPDTLIAVTRLSPAAAGTLSSPSPPACHRAAARRRCLIYRR